MTLLDLLLEKERFLLESLQTSLVDTNWLEGRISTSQNKPEIRIIDARWRGDGSSSRELYQKGHLPTAIHLDWQLDLSWTDERGVRDLLLPPQRFAQVMEAAGIGDDTTVIAYADTDYSGAARLWWALRYYGHQKVAILDGGWDKWLNEGKPITTGENRFTPVSSSKPYRFTARPQPQLLATAAEIKAALEQSQVTDRLVQLVDTRPPEQYAGKAVWTPAGSRFLSDSAETIQIGGRGPMRAGHIPGAINLHASPTFLNQQDWTYLPPAAIQAKISTAGLADPHQRIITYCGVGISASLGLFGLHLAGFSNLALYDASWEEWGTDPLYPVEKKDLLEQA